MKYTAFWAIMPRSLDRTRDKKKPAVNKLKFTPAFAGFLFLLLFDPQIGGSFKTWDQEGTG
jgi:hypothetical protein